MDLLKLREEKRFLGADFLTWLWVAAEARAGRFELEDGAKGAVWPGDQLILG